MDEYWVVSAVGRGLPKVIAAVIVSLSKYVSCAFDFCNDWSVVMGLILLLFLLFFLSCLGFPFPSFNVLPPIADRLPVSCLQLKRNYQPL